MKITLINHFPLTGSGSGTYTRNIAEYLVDRGHDVSIIFPENVPVQKIDGLEGVELFPVYFTGDEPVDDALPFNFPCFTTHPRSLQTFAQLNDVQMKQYLDAFNRALDHVCASFQPDIIHGQHMWILSMLAAERSVPTVVTIHGTDMMGCEKWPDLKRYADRAAEKCSAALAISHDNYNQALNLFPGLKDKLILLQNGYNEKIFYPVPHINRTEVLAKYGVPYAGQQIVFFAGKLTRFKGVDTLLRAVSLLEKERKDSVITLIAGDGEEMKALRELAAELHLKTVYFLGNRNQNELRELYNSGDVFAMPSRREPFGLVALEAMACGLPVVATNEGGLPDFVSEKVGKLVPVDDFAGLCRAIMEQLDIVKERGADRRAEVIEYAKGYTQSSFIVKLEKIYESRL